MPAASTNHALQHQLRRRASRVVRSELARRMGYRRVDEKLLEHIDAVLDDELLGLWHGSFDFRYTSSEFLDAMCTALAIDPTLRDLERERILAIVNHRKTAFRPFVFVDTGFERASQPIFVLAFMEGQRRLRFDASFVDLALSEQVAWAQQRVRDHHRETGGELPLWGVIQRYLFQHDHDQVLILDTHGTVISQTNAVRASHARLSVTGHDMTELIHGTDSAQRKA